MSVVEIKDKTDDAQHWNPVDVLEELLKKIKAGEIKPESLVIVLNGEDGITVAQAKCTRSQSHYLLSCAARILEDFVLE